MDHERRLLEAMAPLCEPLYDALTSSVSRVRERLPQLESPQTLPVFAHTCRGLTLLDLKERNLGSWRLKPGNNSAVCLGSGSHTLKLLHQLPGGDTPPPGLNLARKRYFSNTPTLSAEMLPEVDNLIGLWSVYSSGEVLIRVVRPIGVWKYGSQSKVDLDFILPPFASDLDNLRFETAEEDDLFTQLGSIEGNDDEQSGLGS